MSIAPSRGAEADQHRQVERRSRRRAPASSSCRSASAQNRRHLRAEQRANVSTSLRLKPSVSISATRILGHAGRACGARRSRRRCRTGSASSRTARGDLGALSVERQRPVGVAPASRSQHAPAGPRSGAAQYLVRIFPRLSRRQHVRVLRRRLRRRRRRGGVAAGASRLEQRRARWPSAAQLCGTGSLASFAPAAAASACEPTAARTASAEAADDRGRARQAGLGMQPGGAPPGGDRRALASAGAVPGGDPHSTDEISAVARRGGVGDPERTKACSAGRSPVLQQHLDRSRDRPALGAGRVGGGRRGERGGRRGGGEEERCGWGGSCRSPVR